VLARVLGTAPLRWLGDRSYVIYLLQVTGAITVSAVFPTLTGMRYFLMVMVVVVVLSDVVHRWVELPGIRLGKRLAHDRSAWRSVPAESQPAELANKPTDSPAAPR
jgi:peptidoglycan/LPS O-acetylase OafA/YrhL